MKTIRQPTKEIFLNDVKDHRMTIKQDNDLYRHVRYKRDDSNCMYFDLLTWPGFLAITGDMHSYMFARIPDMFCFFRDKNLKINPGYWEEKIQAENFYGSGVREFDIDEFREQVKYYLKEWHDVDLEKSITDTLSFELQDILHSKDEFEAIEAVRNFSFEDIDFCDFWEIYEKPYTYHYIWCCYAIVWGIQQYDKEFDIDTEKERLWNLYKGKKK